MDDSITLIVRAIPRASKSEIIGMVDGSLKVRLAAPPVDGAANTELLKLLARHFGIAKSNITILSGKSSKLKRVRLTSADASSLATILNAKT